MHEAWPNLEMIKYFIDSAKFATKTEVMPSNLTSLSMKLRKVNQNQCALLRKKTLENAREQNYNP